MTLQTLIFRYSFFAVVATIANLITQRLVLASGDSALFFPAAIAAGTLTGLVVKYVLDKRWIFQDKRTGVKVHAHTFALYTTMGLITTAIFWTTETAFWLTWKTTTMREFGAITGLAVGYVVKYKLDRRFVFTDDSLQATR